MNINGISLGTIALVLSGCHVVSENESKVFRYNESANLSSLDPAHARSLEPMWVTDQLFDGLVELTPELKVEPLIAQSFEVNESGTRWTFILRKDVFFPEVPGVPGLESSRRVTAEDVVYSLNRIRDPQVASSGRWILDPLDASAPGGGLLALGSDTVVITLHQPFPPFLGLLTTSYANIVAHEAIEEFGEDFRSHPVGTGPFKLAWWVEDVACVLHRNEVYWEKDEWGMSLPYLEAIHIDFASDMGAEYQGLMQGKYDFMSGLHAAYLEELLDEEGNLRAEHAATIRLEKVPFLKTDYIGINLSPSTEFGGSPLQDVRIRRAMSMAIDRNGIARHLRRGAVVPTQNFVPPSLLGRLRHADFPLQDLAKAKRLVDSVKKDFPDLWGKVTLSTTSDYTDLCAALQFQWRAIGLDVDVEVLASATHREQVSMGHSMMFRKSWLADYADAENFLGLFHSKNFAPGGPNYTRFNSPLFDSTFDSAMNELDETRRLESHRIMNEMVSSDLPVIPLFHDQVSHFIRKNIHGWVISPVNRLDLRRVRKEES